MTRYVLLDTIFVIVLEMCQQTRTWPTFAFGQLINFGK